MIELSLSESFDMLCDKIARRDTVTAYLVAHVACLSGDEGDDNGIVKRFLTIEAWLVTHGYKARTEHACIVYRPRIVNRIGHLI